MPPFVLTEQARRCIIVAEWREQDHPRDEDGKFTDGKGSYRQNTSYGEILRRDQLSKKSARGHVEIPEGVSKDEYISQELGVTIGKAQDYLYAVEAYTGDMYGKIRAYQQGKPVDGDVKFAVDLLEEYIDNAPKWDGGETLRGINLTERELDSFTVGSVHDMMGVSSWTTEEDKADLFSRRDIMKTNKKRVVFHSSTQRKGTSIRHLSAMLSEGYDEKEIVVSSGANYKVKKIVFDVKPIYGSGGVTHIYLEEHDEKI